MQMQAKNSKESWIEFSLVGSHINFVALFFCSFYLLRSVLLLFLFFCLFSVSLAQRSEKCWTHESRIFASIEFNILRWLNEVGKKYALANNELFGFVWSNFFSSLRNESGKNAINKEIKSQLISEFSHKNFFLLWISADKNKNSEKLSMAESYPDFSLYDSRPVFFSCSRLCI